MIWVGQSEEVRTLLAKGFGGVQFDLAGLSPTIIPSLNKHIDGVRLLYDFHRVAGLSLRCQIGPGFVVLFGNVSSKQMIDMADALMNPKTFAHSKASSFLDLSQDCNIYFAAERFHLNLIHFGLHQVVDRNSYCKIVDFGLPSM